MQLVEKAVDFLPWSSQFLSSSNPQDVEISKSSKEAKNPTPKLPTELVLLILTHLDPSSSSSNSLSTLLSCSLVNHTFLTLARRILFTHLHLTPRRQLTLARRVPELLVHPLATIPACVDTLHIYEYECEWAYRGDGGGSQCMDAMALLCPLGANVRCLDIRADGNTFSESYSQSQPPSSPSLFTDAKKLLSDSILFFRNPQQAYPNSSPNSKVTTALPIHRFKHITTLRLHARFFNFAQMVVFICDFPFLEELEIKASYPDSPKFGAAGNKLNANGPLACCSPSPHLRKLHIISARPDDIFAWFLSLSKTSSPGIGIRIGIEDLHIERFPCAYERQRVVNAFLQTLGPALRRLSIKMDHILPIYATTQPPLDLSHNTHLQTLSIQIGSHTFTKCTIDPSSLNIHITERCPSSPSSFPSPCSPTHSSTSAFGSGFGTSDASPHCVITNPRYGYGRTFSFVDAIFSTFPCSSSSSSSTSAISRHEDAADREEDADADADVDAGENENSTVNVHELHALEKKEEQKEEPKEKETKEEWTIIVHGPELSEALTKQYFPRWVARGHRVVYSMYNEQ